MIQAELHTQTYSNIFKRRLCLQKAAETAQPSPYGTEAGSTKLAMGRGSSRKAIGGVAAHGQNFPSLATKKNIPLLT